MHCIDMNAWYSRIDKPHRPDFVLFDLDPPDDDFAASVEVALLIHEALGELDLEAWPKTSGAGGMHVLVPIARRAGYDDTYEFAERLSRLLEERHPGTLTTEWRKEKRRGVLVDHRQNGWGKTIASAYSVRPKPGAPVSTPLRWEELHGRLDYRSFTMTAARDRLEREGDLFAPVLETRQALGPALRELRTGATRPKSRT
jgi:bifunctional non-homologous end joining protein LigD